MEKKFKLTSNTITIGGVTLHQIQALRSFGNVKEGDLGGYVESEENLSYEGDCWVFDNAVVYGNAKVSGYARVFGYAQVSGNAHVSGYARVFGYAQVSGNARVFGYARVSGNAHVSGDAVVFDNAWVFGYARVSGNAVVYGNAKVYSDAWVYGDAWVSGYAQVSRTPKILTGFPHMLLITDHHIKAGCEQHSPSVWAKKGAAIIKNDGFSSKEAKKWAKIINLIAEAHGCTDLEDQNV